MALNSKHLEDLRKSTLTDETIARYQLQSLSEEETREELDRADIEGGGLLIPYPGSSFFRVRLDKPLVVKRPGKKNQVCKYLNLSGISPDLFITYSANEMRANLNTPYYFTEGEKKAIALEQFGYAAVGLPGIYCGWSKNKEVAQPLLNLPLNGRPCYVVFDSDKYDNPMVLKAEYDFASVLHQLGAIPFIVNLDKTLGKGIDDQIAAFIRAGNPEDIKKQYLESPETYEEYIARNKKLEGSPASPYTGVWNAEKFVEYCGTDIRWCQELKKWFVWSGKYWREDPGALAVERLAKGITKEMLKAKDERIRDHGKSCQNKKKLEEMIELSKSEDGVEISSKEFNANGYLLNCANGTIDLRTGELLPHKKDDFITRIVNVVYDKNASCPRWESFLNMIFVRNQDTIRFLQKAAAYSRKYPGCSRYHSRDTQRAFPFLTLRTRKNSCLKRHAYRQHSSGHPINCVPHIPATGIHNTCGEI